MKYISIILMSLFLVGNANAINTEIDDVCKWAETKVVKSMIDANIYKGYYEGMLKSKHKEFRDDADNYLKGQKENESRIEKYAKVYHYLDCSRFKWDYYELFPN